MALVTEAGMCDFDETRITAENAKDLCDPEINASAGHWQQCLQEICRLLEAGWGRTGLAHESGR